MSRTAKNQKDFKIQAMDRWKYGKKYAIVVCPVYQLPARASQIYEQASTRSVCIGTYTHLAVLSRYAYVTSTKKAMTLMKEIFESVNAMYPSKDAASYWQVVNRTMINFEDCISDIWNEEKKASADSIKFSKTEALSYLAHERERIMKLSKYEAIREVLKSSKIENKITAINSVGDNGLLLIT